LNLTITGEAVAWWGAITGTVALTVNVYLAWRDSARLRIVVAPGMRLMSPLAGYPADKSYISVDVANRGRRPITVTKAWFVLARSQNKGLIIDSVRGGPKELSEGQGTSWLAREDSLGPAIIKGIVVEDQTGRRWKKRLRRIKLDGPATTGKESEE
jgi:hypothetical protein